MQITATLDTGQPCAIVQSIAASLMPETFLLDLGANIGPPTAIAMEYCADTFATTGGRSSQLICPMYGLAQTDLALSRMEAAAYTGDMRVKPLQGVSGAEYVT
jgi:hypothetical protein